MGFLVWPQNQGRRFVSGLALKPLGQDSRFGPQNWQLRFGNLGLKTGSYGLVIWASKYHNGFLDWASKPSGLQFVSCTTKSMGG
jgi:hypothetical protein